MLPTARGSRESIDACTQGSSQFQSRVGQARFERRPTMKNLRELIVGLRGEAPLVPPYILCNFKLDGAGHLHRWLNTRRSRHFISNVFIGEITALKCRASASVANALYSQSLLAATCDF